MNEHGRIYLGSSDLPRAIPWYFGQFESTVLRAALTLLNQIPLTAAGPVEASTMILRILSSKICSSRSATDGIFRSLLNTRPFSTPENGYISSAAILNQYLQSNNQGINNGTNWQHAAVLCSLCRSLGIPTRMVTVYNATFGGEENTEGSIQSSTRGMTNTEATRSVLSFAIRHTCLISSVLF